MLSGFAIRHPGECRVPLIVVQYNKCVASAGNFVTCQLIEGPATGFECPATGFEGPVTGFEGPATGLSFLRPA